MEIFKVWHFLTVCVSVNVIALDSIYKRKLQKVYTSENVFLHRFPPKKIKNECFFCICIFI